MRRSVLSSISAVVAVLAVAALRCNSVLGSGALSPEPCTENCGPCTTYCNAIMQSCPADGGSAEYLTTDVCLLACSANSSYWLSRAFADDTTTFACRQGRAGDAGAGISCANAGPLGGAVGAGGCLLSAVLDPCTSFCQLEFQVCAEYPQYKSVADCQQYCQAQKDWYVLPDSGSDLTPHENGDDTLNCRFYHLENAMKHGTGFGPAIHCNHTGPTATNMVCKPSAAPSPLTDAADEGASQDE